MDRIPEISDDDLRELASKIKPVVRFSETGGEQDYDLSGRLFYIEEVDLREIAFTCIKYSPALT